MKRMMRISRREKRERERERREKGRRELSEGLKRGGGCKRAGITIREAEEEVEVEEAKGADSRYFPSRVRQQGGQGSCVPDE